MIPLLLELMLRAGVAVLLLGALLTLFAKAPRASLTVVLVLAVLEGSREWLLPLGVSLGPLNVNWADIATALMGVVAVWRLAWRFMAQPGRDAFLGMFAMIAAGLVSWTIFVGLQPAVNAWRPWTFAMAAALYAAASPSLREPDGLRPFLWAGLLASAMQVIGIALRGFGSNTDSVIVDGQLAGARPISAAVALVMLIGLTYLLLDSQPWTPRKAVVATWFGLSIVVAQHRSVWVAAVVAGLLIIRALVSRSRQRLVVGSLSVFAAVVITLVLSAIIRSQGALASSASNTETFDWRVENWTEKLTDPRSFFEWLFGATFGPTPVAQPDPDLVFNVSAHSIYVETVTVLGLVGLVLLVLVMISALRESPLVTPVGVVLVILMAFGFFYQWPGVAWFVMGVGLAGSVSSPDVGVPETERKSDRHTRRQPLMTGSS